MKISRHPYNSIAYKFILGEFSEADFQEIYGPSLGTHFYKRYDTEHPWDGIKSLFRQFSGGNESKLLNLFSRDVIDPGIATYQLLCSTNDRDGNPRRLVLMYDALGEIRKAIRYQHSDPQQAIREARRNPDHYSRLPDMDLSEAGFDRWVVEMDERDLLERQA